MLVMGSHHYVQVSEENTDPAMLDSVKIIKPTGASVPAVCTDKLKSKFPMCVFYVNLYGQTESGIVILGNQEMVGLGPIKPGCRIKVCNIDILCFTVECAQVDHIKYDSVFGGTIAPSQSPQSKIGHHFIIATFRGYGVKVQLFF